MSLGYRGNPSWRDMSDYVVHFTKDTEQNTAYDNMMSILWGGQLIPGGRFGAARKFDELGDSQSCVCFSEIPLDLLGRMVERRSAFGVGFRRQTLIDAGGARVWYVDKGTAADAAVVEMMERTQRSKLSVDNPLWKLTPFIDVPGEYESTRYRFEWEREWRVPGPLTFSTKDVAFLFVPGELHAKARWFFEYVEAENIGPSYRCPLIDPSWENDAIDAALAPRVT